MKNIGITALAILLVFATGCEDKQTGIRSESSPDGASVTQSQPDASLPESSGETGVGECVEPLPDETVAQLKREADALTQHLVNRVLRKANVADGEEITELELLSFFLTLPSYMNHPDHPYRDAIIEIVEPPETPVYRYVFPEQKVRQAAYELFGVQNFTLEHPELEYNAEAGQHESTLEFGTGWLYYSCSDLQVEYDDTQGIVEVTFALEEIVEIDGDPAWDDGGDYLMQYQVIQENSVFLRYKGVQKL